jgi:hypothetical protein
MRAHVHHAFEDFRHSFRLFAVGMGLFIVIFAVVITLLRDLMNAVLGVLKALH